MFIGRMQKKRSLVILTEYELGRFSVRETSWGFSSDDLKKSGDLTNHLHINNPPLIVVRGRFIVCEFT